MTLSTFLIATSIVILLAIFIRIFWVQLFLIWLILQVLFWITVFSALSAVGWMVFVEDYRSGPIDGFGLTWLFFFITYSIGFLVTVFISFDIYKYFKGFIRDLFKK